MMTNTGETLTINGGIADFNKGNSPLAGNAAGSHYQLHHVGSADIGEKTGVR